MITYGNIEIEAKYEIQEILNIKTIEELNQHSKIIIEGIVPDKDKIEAVTKMGQNDVIKMKAYGKPFFVGIIQKTSVKNVNGVYRVIIEASSSTIQMDKELKSKSFQNKEMTYKEVFKKITKKYIGSDYIDNIMDQNILNMPIIQYEETDWTFLKRLASLMRGCLIANRNTEKAKFLVGMPVGKERFFSTQESYTLEKNFEEMINKKKNVMEEVHHVETDELWNLGDYVQLNGIKHMVVKSIGKLEDGRMVFNYELSSNVLFPPIFNKNFQGLSIKGKVIDRKADFVKIHLDIDKEQAVDTAHLFPMDTPYSVEPGCGMYIMPEKNDNICLYFKNCIEVNAVAKACLAEEKSADRENPRIKTLKTPWNKKLRMMEKSLEFETNKEMNSMKISMNEEDGIHIMSSKQISISSLGNTSITASNISFSAADDIKVVGGISTTLIQGVIHFKAPIVKQEGKIK